MSYTQDSRILTGIVPLPTAPDSVTTLPQLFQHQARAQPESIAFSLQTTGGLTTVTYSAADATARCIAVRIKEQIELRSDGKAPVVAVWLEKGLDLVLSILAVTYSGATWLPLDPDVPVERASVCIVDASVAFIVCDDAHIDQVRQLQAEVNPRLMTAGRPPMKACTFAELSREQNIKEYLASGLQRDAQGPRPDDAAYLIYTSGTTGLRETA